MYARSDDEVIGGGGGYIVQPIYEPVDVAPAPVVAEPPLEIQPWTPPAEVMRTDPISTTVEPVTQGGSMFGGAVDSMGNDVDSLPHVAKVVFDGNQYMMVDAAGGELGVAVADYKATSGIAAQWGIPRSVNAAFINDGSGYYGGDPRTHGYTFVNPGSYATAPIVRETPNVVSNVTILQDGVVYQGGADTTIHYDPGSGQTMPSGEILGSGTQNENGAIVVTEMAPEEKAAAQAQQAAAIETIHTAATSTPVVVAASVDNAAAVGVAAGPAHVEDEAGATVTHTTTGQTGGTGTTAGAGSGGLVTQASSTSSLLLIAAAAVGAFLLLGKRR